MVKELDRTLRKNRKIKNIIVLGLEGKNNRTEELYFTSLEKRNDKYHFVFAGGKNDPVGIVKNTIYKAKSNDINITKGDLAFSVFDVDLDKAKENNIELAKQLAKKSKYKVDVITSNPCFEVWYMQHFNYSTKPFSSSDEAINKLSKYIKDYSKTKDYSDLLLPKTKYAINNAQRLYEHNKKYSLEKNDVYYNPSTRVDKIVKNLV